MHTSNYFIHRVRNYYNSVSYVGFFCIFVVTCEYIIFWQNIFLCFRSNRFGTVAPVNGGAALNVSTVKKKDLSIYFVSNWDLFSNKFNLLSCQSHYFSLKWKLLIQVALKGKCLIRKGKCLKKNPIFVEKDLENGDSESGVEPDHKIFTVYASEEVR